jgi:hypothetical protein
VSQRRYLVSQTLIAANIERIAAVSWDGYQKSGRGVVLIDGDVLDEQNLHVGPLTYLSDTEAQETRGGWPTEEVAGIVRVYDPEGEVIVVVRWRNGVGAYRFKPNISPPDAFQRFKEMSH